MRRCQAEEQDLLADVELVLPLLPHPSKVSFHLQYVHREAEVVAELGLQ